MNGSYDCERKWISPKGNSHARSALRDILGGGEMRQPAHDVETMRPQDFRDEYNGEEWWFDYVFMKKKFIEKCDKNPHASFHNHGGARTRRSKKNRKTRKARK